MPRYIWLLAIATTISVTGGSFLWPLNTIYMHNELGKSLAFAGVVLMLKQGATIVGNLIGGVLFDKYSPYKTIIYGTLLSLVSVILLAIFHSYIFGYTLFLILIGFGTGVTWPIMFAMAGSLWPEGGRRAFNAVYVAQNLGVAVGATIGGYVASISFNYIFIANASLFVVFLVFVMITFRGIDQERDRQMHTTILQQKNTLKDRASFIALIILSLGFLFVWLAYSQWQTTIASHTQDIGIPLEKYSMLWAINGFLIVLGQPLIKWFTERVTSEHMQIYVGNFILLLSFFIAMFAKDFTIFVVSMTILTLGEMLVWPAIPSLANDLAPRGRAGFYQGFVNSVAAAGRMIGPVLGGVIVDYYNIEVLFYLILIIMIVPFLTTRFYNIGLKNEIYD